MGPKMVSGGTEVVLGRKKNAVNPAETTRQDVPRVNDLMSHQV